MPPPPLRLLLALCAAASCCRAALTPRKVEFTCDGADHWLEVAPGATDAALAATVRAHPQVSTEAMVEALLAEAVAVRDALYTHGDEFLAGLLPATQAEWESGWGPLAPVDWRAPCPELTGCGPSSVGWWRPMPAAAPATLMVELLSRSGPEGTPFDTLRAVSFAETAAAADTWCGTAEAAATALWRSCEEQHAAALAIWAAGPMRHAVRGTRPDPTAPVVATYAATVRGVPAAVDARAGEAVVVSVGAWCHANPAACGPWQRHALTGLVGAAGAACAAADFGGYELGQSADPLLKRAALAEAVLAVERATGGAKPMCVETGTFIGMTSTWLAETAGCSAVTTIELSHDHLQVARAAWRADPRWTSAAESLEPPPADVSAKIQYFEGHSSEVLAGPLFQGALRDAPTVFFLDAHFSLIGTARYKSEDSPTYKELKAVLSRRNPLDLVVIDDARNLRGARLSAGFSYADLADLQALACAVGGADIVLSVWGDLVFLSHRTMLPFLLERL